MRGGLLKTKSPARKKKAQARKPPRRARRITKRDIERLAYREAGALNLLKKIRNTPTDIVRGLRAAGVSQRAIDAMPDDERLTLATDMIAMGIGISRGRQAGTEPELRVVAWMVNNDFRYGGSNRPPAALNGDWGFQVPLIGGRGASGGGAVADIFIGAGKSAARTDKGTAVRVNGAYWHMQTDVHSRDEAAKTQMQAAGYAVADLWDYEVLSPGTLDGKMKEIVR